MTGPVSAMQHRLTGDEKPLAAPADVTIRVPSEDTPIIQQVHLAIEHLICHLVERAPYP